MLKSAEHRLPCRQSFRWPRRELISFRASEAKTFKNVAAAITTRALADPLYPNRVAARYSSDISPSFMFSSVPA